MGSVSALNAASSIYTVITGPKSLSGTQANGLLIKGNLTVSGDFYVPGDLIVQGNLIFNSPTSFTVTGTLNVQNQMSGTMAGPFIVNDDTYIDSQLYSYGSLVVSSSVFEPYTAATTVNAASDLTFTATYTVLSSAFTSGDTIVTLTAVTSFPNSEDKVYVGPAYTTNYNSNLFNGATAAGSGTPVGDGTNKISIDFQNVTSTFTPGTVLKFISAFNLQTLVNLTTSVLVSQQIIRVSPFTSDLFIMFINSGTQLAVDGDFRSTFPANTAVRLYDQSNVTRINFSSGTTPTGSSILRKQGSTTNYSNQASTGLSYAIVNANQTSIFTTSSVVTFHDGSASQDPPNAVPSFAGGGFAMTFGRNLYFGGSVTMSDVLSWTISGDLKGVLKQETISLTKTVAPLVGTTLDIGGDIKWFTTISNSGGNSSSIAGGNGGGITVGGSVFGPYQSAGITLTSNGGAYNGSGAFAGGNGGNITIRGIGTNVALISSNGGSSQGTTVGGAGGTIQVFGPLAMVGSAQVLAQGGGASTAGVTGGAGGTVSLFSIGAGNIFVTGGSPQLSGATSVGGAGGSVTITNGCGATINASAGNGGKTGGAGGTVTVTGPFSSGGGITATGGEASNTAINSRVGGLGGTVTITGGSGSVGNITTSGGRCIGGTGTGQVAGNGGNTIISGSLTVSQIISNGGSSLTTASSFAGSPGSVTLTGIIYIGNIFLRTTPQTGISGTAPTTMASGKGAILLNDGYYTVNTIDLTNISGSRIWEPNNAALNLTLTVDALTTKNTLNDSSGNPQGSSQATLCKSRIYKYSTAVGGWNFITSSLLT